MTDQIQMLIDQNNLDHAEIKRLIRTQNGRVKNLELWRAKLVGICAGVSGLATAIVLVIRFVFFK